ncbi:peptidoglycan DD-metalloendopeptidase family protein [Patescibacteria group bacterium]|nr:peptidoglycan DD-metalloendopeptidase family protein [Patescibacteria group bacterium]
MKTKTAKNKIKILTIFLIAIFLIPVNFSQTLQAQTAEGGVLEEFDPKIQELKEEIAATQQKVEELQHQQKVYEENIKVKRQQINNLNNQLGILDDTIAKLAIEIQTTQLQMEQTDLEIKNVKLRINIKEEEIKSQQAKISEVLRTVNKSDRKKSSLEILILQGSLSNFFNEINKLQSLDYSLNDQLGEFRELKNDLETKKNNLETRQLHLDNLKDQLSTQQEKEEQDKQAKFFLIQQTRGQESSFQDLLTQAKSEQAALEGEIQSLEVRARQRLMETQGRLPTDEDFIWPISSRKITATFHDPDYPFRYIFEHPAIDIGSTPQGSLIRAARSGYVARVKYDNSTSYAYIMLVHTGGLSTVYGHISKPLIEEDSFVVQGQIIAQSGGTPGTYGAGRLTTGPHLHFEVRLNGIPVDPLNYLP